MKVLLLFLCLGLVSSHPHSSEECEVSEKYQMKMMSPFGCMDVKPTMEMMDLMKDCFMKPMREIAGNALLGKIPNLSSLRDQLAKAIECKYEAAGVLDNGRLSSAKVQKLLDDTDMEGEDVNTFNEFTMDCTNNANTDGSVVKQAVEVETCISKSMIEFCENKGESTGALPFVSALLTIAYKNESCMSVKVPKEVDDAYVECLKNPTEKKMDNAFKGMSGMKKAFLEALIEIPEIKAMCCAAEKLNLVDDEGTDFDAVANYVESFEGWQDDVKNSIIEDIYDCGAKADEEEGIFKKEMVFNKCFLPKLGSTCGFDNGITKDFFYPIFDPRVMEGITGSLKNMMRNRSPLKSMVKVMKMKMLRLTQKLIMDGGME